MPCSLHQGTASQLRASITNGGVEVPEVDDAWMCPTSMRRSVLPISWECEACRSYYVHRAIVLPQMSILGTAIDDMTIDEKPRWRFRVPACITREEVLERMALSIHCILPDVIELHNSKNHTFWLLRKEHSGRKFSILMCLSRPSDRMFASSVRGGGGTESACATPRIRSETRGSLFSLGRSDSSNSIGSVGSEDPTESSRATWTGTISMAAGTAEMNRLATQRKEMEDMVLTQVDLLHRKNVRATALAVNAPFARKSKQAMVLRQSGIMPHIFKREIDDAAPEPITIDDAMVTRTRPRGAAVSGRPGGTLAQTPTLKKGQQHYPFRRVHTDPVTKTRGAGADVSPNVSSAWTRGGNAANNTPSVDARSVQAGYYDEVTGAFLYRGVSAGSRVGGGLSKRAPPTLDVGSSGGAIGGDVGSPSESLSDSVQTAMSTGSTAQRVESGGSSPDSTPSGGRTPPTPCTPPAQRMVWGVSTVTAIHRFWGRLRKWNRVNVAQKDQET
jgi:hypothetical protein